MGSNFKTTRRNLDLDIDLKVKLQKPTNKKSEEKRKLNRKKGWEPSDDKHYTMNFFHWRMETPPNISPPFHPKQKIYQEYMFEAESTVH